MPEPPPPAAPAVRIRRVRAYDAPALDAAVGAILDGEPGLAAWLGEADPARLVVVKPNWIRAEHERRPDVWEPVITHPSVVLAAVRALAERMRGRGTICLCDAPSTETAFDAVVARGGLPAALEALRGRYPELRIELLDLRREVWRVRDGVVAERRANPPDPRGYVRVDLGRDSLFHAHPSEGRYYGADYDDAVVNAHHWGDTHEYLLAGTAMRADLLVNLPKLKTHKKTGLTCALKNLVGINGDKNWLPHFARGTSAEHGDEFDAAPLARRAEGRARRAGQRLALRVPGLGPWLYARARGLGLRLAGGSDRVVRAGNWWGNDTCWRMALDLNRALLYGRADGPWGGAGERRRYVAIVDAVVAGEGDGPQAPDAVRAGLVFGGADPAAVDAVAARLMGFDVGALAIVRRAFDRRRWPIATRALEETTVDDERAGAAVPLDAVRPAVPGGFRPHFGWTDRLRPGGGG